MISAHTYAVDLPPADEPGKLDVTVGIQESREFLVAGVPGGDHRTIVPRTRMCSACCPNVAVSMLLEGNGDPEIARAGRLEPVGERVGHRTAGGRRM
jgi:hypothetical protein